MMAGGSERAARQTSTRRVPELAATIRNGRELTMKPTVRFPLIDRRILLSSLAMLPLLSALLRSHRGGTGTG